MSADREALLALAEAFAMAVVERHLEELRRQRNEDQPKDEPRAA